MCFWNCPWPLYYYYQNSMLQSEQKSKQNFNSEVQSRLRLIGYCSMKMFERVSGVRIEEMLHEMVNAAFNKHKKQYKFHPLKVFALPSCIAVIDNKNKLWAFIDLINEPICLSDMIKLRVTDLALHYNQMILNTSEGRLLLTWGGKRYFAEKQLSKLTIKNQKFKYAHFFELYEIDEGCDARDRFFYAHSQKINSENIVYQLTDDSQAIVVIPAFTKIHFKKKISGISLGRYHNLLWDTQGKLYSWGCKSIALGYSSLPDKELIEHPTEVDLLRGHITKAYAGVNYSLAITLEGKLYEWGINRVNPRREEIIFQPKEIRTNNSSKFIDLKGNQEKYGVLSLVGQLYVWGKNANTLFGPVNHHQLSSENYVLEPTLINKNMDFILDFEIEDAYIVLITSNRSLQTFSENRRMYWTNLMDSIQQNLKGKPEKTRMSSNEGGKRPKLEELTLSSSTFRKLNDPIEIAFERRKAKQSYLSSAMQPEKTINYLMQPSERSIYSSNFLSQMVSCQLKQQKTSQKRGQSKRFNTAIDDFSSDFKKEKEYVQSLVNKIESMKTHTKMMRFNRNHGSTVKTNRINDSYENRLQSVKKRREQNQVVFIEETLRKVENRSFQFRIAKRQENEEVKKKSKECQLYKQFLQKFMIKQFLVKLLTKPIAEGREVKIATFARYLKLERLEKKIRGLFIRTRVKFNMRKLHHNQVFRFFLLTMTFQQYVKRFRLKKSKKLRKMIVGEIFKGVVRQKFKIGLTACNFSIRKLQKFREWLTLVKAERRRCLKYIWKVHLLSIMKINPDSESSAIFYLPRNYEDLTFEAIYQEKVAMNPLLRLANFLNHHSIFKIKTTIFQQLFILTRNENNKEKAGKVMKGLAKSRRFRIKFSEDEDDKQDRLNLIQTDIFPYSMHYNIVVHPKNYDITIPEIMKVSEKWIKEQKKILEKHIEVIIKSHEVQYLAQRRKYDVDLAHYIKKNYDVFSEKRWKFIIEYNKIEKKQQKSKKEKQIRRLMKLIGAERLLDQDCIPEKQTILDEVFKRSDGPQLPSCYITFGANQFKKLFKIYYEAVSSKAKEMRRNFL